MNFAPVKLIRVLAHAYWGIAQAVLILPFTRDLDRRRLTWSRKLLAILRVRCQVIGTPPPAEPGIMLAANHVSWLDIYALLTLLPVRFVSKSEVRRWPLVGRLAAASGTLFIERAKRSDAHRINQEIAAHLRAGECLAFFPEGTTTDGMQLLPFHAPLFQPAVDAEVPVIPVALRYLTPAGESCPDAAYHGEMSFAESLLRIARMPGLVVEIRFLPVIEPTGLDRRELARQTEAAVKLGLGIRGT